jgi:Beta-lactamase enzyme family
MTFFQADAQLEQALRQILDAAWTTFPALAQNQIALTWLVYDPPYSVNTGGALSPTEFWQQKPRGASYRGVERIYPASVVKLFYLVALHEWLEQGMIASCSELERAARDMIVDSSNDATALVIDTLTGTTSGPELSDGPFQTWQQQRNLINRYLQSLQWPELATVNVNQKTWCDGPYGRERVFLGELYENRNLLTTEATARLLHSIIGGVSVSPQRSSAMMALMRRSLKPADLEADPENQVSGFLGGGLPETVRLWSKAGLTSKVRHDAVYVEAQDRPPYLLVVFTEGDYRAGAKGGDRAQLEALLPWISKAVFTAVGKAEMAS